MTQPSNVVDLTTPSGAPNPGGPGNGGSNVGERLARIETKLEHVATREGLAEVKVLIERKESTTMRWLLGIIAVALISVVVALIRTFIPGR